MKMFSLVKDTAMVAFKKREGNARKKIILTLLVVAILYGPGHGKLNSSKSHKLITQVIIKLCMTLLTIKLTNNGKYVDLVH